MTSYVDRKGLYRKAYHCRFGSSGAVAMTFGPHVDNIIGSFSISQMIFHSSNNTTSISAIVVTHSEALRR